MKAKTLLAAIAIAVASPATGERSDIDMYETFRSEAERRMLATTSTPTSQWAPPSRAAVAAMVAAEARRQGVPERLALAVAHQESRFNPRAHSYQNAKGVMQVLPSTARVLGHRGPSTELFRPEVNIPLGVAYLKQGLAEGGMEWAVARYHGGPNTRMHGPKTRAYTRTVLAKAGMTASMTGGWLQVGSVAVPWAHINEGRSL